MMRVAKIDALLCPNGKLGHLHISAQLVRLTQLPSGCWLRAGVHHDAPASVCTPICMAPGGAAAGAARCVAHGRRQHPIATG